MTKKLLGCEGNSKYEKITKQFLCILAIFSYFEFPSQYQKIGPFFPPKLYFSRPKIFGREKIGFWGKKGSNFLVIFEVLGRE